MKKHLLKSLLLTLMVLVGGSAWAGDKTVVKYSFDDAMSPSLTAGSRVGFDYDKTSVITSTKFLNAWNNTNGDPGATTVSLGNTDLSGETWTLSFEWAACGGCNGKADHTTLKAGDTNLFDLTGNSNWNTTVTITYAGSDGTKTLPVPGCDKNKRFKTDVGDQLNTTAYWHHIVVTGSASGVKMTITNSSTGTAVVEDVLLSETNVNPTSLIIEPCCGGAIGIDELSLTYFVEGEVIQTPTANYTAVNGIERTITATCDTEGATLYYSTDSENWTEGASITVSASGNVYFKAVKGNSESDVLTFAAVAGEAITLNAPTIVRSDNTTVTISADQTDLLLSPTATIKYTYGNEAGEFTGSKTLTVAADATITAYAEAEGYTKSVTSELAVALFPEYVNSGLNTPTKTSGTSSFALSTETITVSGREYAALLLDGVQWGTNVYLQNLTITDPIVWGIRNGNWYINTTDPQWILIRNLKAGDIVVVDVTYPAADMVNATYSEKLSFGTKHAYMVNADGDVELDLRKINAKEMNYFYGVYSYSPMSDEEVAAIEAFQNAKTALAAAIAEAKAIETEGKEGVEALQTAIATAETALAAEDATTESLTNAKNALAEAVAAFKVANFDIATAIANADFSADEVITTKICTYTKDVKEGEFSNMQPLTGWTIVENGDARAAGTFAYGSTAILGGDGGNVPAVGPNGETEGKVLGLEAVWSATTQYTQEVTLPAGDYLMEAVVYNAAGTGALSQNLIGIDGTYCTTKNYPVGKWTKDQVKITLAEAKTVTVSIGVNSGNVGNAAAPHLFIDHVKLYGSEEIAAIELAAAKENALAAIEALPAGEGLFYYSQTDIDNAKIAVNAAETVEAVAAVAMPTPNAPAADKAYAIANATATGNLCITEGKVSVAKDAAVYFTAVEGGYVLSNEAGDYIFKTDNDWTLSTTKEIASAYVVTIVPVESGYTIKGAKGLFGLDSTDEGSTVYANKSQDKNGLWTIAEYVAPVAPTTDYTDYIANADLTGEGGFDATGTKGIDGSGIVKVGNAAAFDFKQTIENLPAGKYKVTAQAAYRYGGDEQAEYNAMQTENTITKFVQFYATVGTTTVDTLVQNRYDGASETNLFNGEGGVSVVNEKYVPNSSDAVKAWFAAGKYVNEVVFNLPADGAVTIGINRTGTPESDYTVIGPWTLTRLGDAEVEPEPEPEPFFADGKYYIYNNGTKNYLAAGADWGTHAVVNATGLDYTLTQADGKYTMDSQISNGGNNHFLNGEWNDGSAMGWTFAAVEGKEGVYTISNGEKFLTAAENNLVTLADDATAEAAQWSLKTLEARIAELATATAEAPVNATFLIQDANFGRNDLRKSAWTMEASNLNLTNLSNGNNTNNNAESYHSVFTLSQVLTNVPKGVYSLTAQGFYRQDGEDNENLPVFFANDYTQTFPLKTGSENSMADASTSFSAGNYTIDPIYFQLTEAGDLTVGAKLATNTNLWCNWDNFQLTYYGVGANLDEVKNAAIIKELADLRAKAEALKAEVEVDAVKTAIDEALGATAEASGADAINTAIATMKAVIEKADVHIAAKAALDGMANVMAGTNVYTAEAFETYNGIYETAKGKYQAGELTKDDVIENPEAQMGWHAANTVDDLLLSVWTIGETQCKDYDAGMYINTWSVEGNNDGSNFKVPFFEYWTADANSLGENVLTATMTNLPEGEYDVTAWVRVRMKNGAEAPTYGITFQANDGEAVNVAAGDQIGTSQMYLKEFTATGTVAADGVLKIKFNVAADNNISWLSFKNVKFEKKTTAEDIALGNAIDALKAIIAAAKAIETEGKNGADALNAAITPAETALNAADATIESLAAAKEALAQAISVFNKANLDADLIEIAQSQGKDLDTFTRTDLVEGAGYNTYTANGDLNIAIKMMNVDVKDCDYVVIKFAEPVAAGWHLAFWSNQDLVDVPEGATEFTYVFANDPNCGVSAEGVLPQICMMTFFGGFQAPLVAKIEGIYKHQVPVEIPHTWDFTKWSDETVANLKADAAASKVAGWSDVEKKADAEADADPTEASKDNCFWATIAKGGELKANDVVIEELKGLQFDATFAGNRSLAIAVNYASTSLGEYHGASYLWLGGKNFECFTIPAVKGGTTIKMGVESHKPAEARGVQLFAGETELKDADGNAVAAPKTYTEQSWVVPAGVAFDIVVKNTNGCHIYFIDAEQDEDTLTAISTLKSNDRLNGTIYNLNGQKVQKAQRGLYIVNGKKVVIK